MPRMQTEKEKKIPVKKGGLRPRMLENGSVSATDAGKKKNPDNAAAAGITSSETSATTAVAPAITAEQ